MPPTPQTDHQWEIILRRLSDAETALQEARREIGLLHASPSPTAAAPHSPAEHPRAPVEAAAVIPGRPDKVRTLTGEQLVLRLIAGAGVIITVLGVVFAVTVAIQNGWLGPLWRVILTSMLALALAGAAVVVHKRRGPAAGVAALLVTSILTSFLLVLSLVGSLEWWSPGVGALAFILLWSAYLMLYRAYHWQVVALVLTVLGMGLSAIYPLLFDTPPEALVWGVTLLPFLTLGATWGESAVHPRRWALVAIAVASLLHNMQWEGSVIRYGVALAASLVILVVCLRDPVDKRTDVHIGLGSAAVAVIAAALQTPSPALGFILPALVSFLYASSARLSGPSNREFGDLLRAHTAWLLPVSLLVPLGTQMSGVGDSGPVASLDTLTRLLVLGGFCLFVVLPLRVDRVRDLGLAGWLLATFLITLPLLFSLMGGSTLRLTRVSWLAAALLCGAVVTLLIVRRRSLTGMPRILLGLLVAVGLLLSMYAVVIPVVWASNQLGGQSALETGFLMGHALVSVGWMLVAAWALLGRAPIPDSSSMWIGGSLAAAAVIKLVFFDLQALTGIARALAFLVCGLVLLTIVSLRARSLPAETPKT